MTHSSPAPFADLMVGGEIRHHAGEEWEMDAASCQCCYVPTMTPISPPNSPADAPMEPDFVVVDVETSCSRVSSICQIGIVGFRNGAEIFEYETLVDPLDRFSSFNTRIHGITANHIVGRPTFGHIHQTVHGHLAGRITVAHSYFDKVALGAACGVHRCMPIKTTWLDSVRVAKRAWPELPNHRLNVLSSFLGIQHRHHDALSDARTAGMVVIKAIEHTGIGLAGWLSPTNPKGGPAPKPSLMGPLKGERVAILGAPRDGPLGRLLAELGARVVASAGRATTMLVVSSEQPFGSYFTAHSDHRRAEAMRAAGSAIQILIEEELRTQLAEQAALFPHPVDPASHQ